MKIQTRLLVSIIPILIILFGFSTIITGVFSSSYIKTQAREQAQIFSFGYAIQLNSRINQYLNTAEDLANAVITAINIETTLKDYKKRYTQFSRIFYTPENGVIHDMAPYDKNLLGSRLSDFDAWEAVQKEKKAVMSSPGIYFGEPSVVIIAPVQLTFVDNQPPRLVGYVAVLLPLKFIFQNLNEYEKGQLGSLFVVDQRGQYIHNQDQKLILNSGIDILSSTRDLSRISESMHNQESGFATFSNRQSRKYIAYSPITTTGWSLGVHGSYDEITSGILRITYISLLIVMVGIILGVIVLYFVIHSIVRPIKHLTLVAQVISKGNRTIQSDIKSSSEIGQLSDSINLMVRELRDHQIRLEYTVDKRTMELKRANDELGQTVEELNSANSNLVEISQDLEKRVNERTADLQKAHQYIDNIINSMPSVLIGIDPDCVITQWNNEAVRITQIPYSEAVGQPLESVCPYFSEKLEEIREALKRKEKLQFSNCTPLENRSSHYDDITVYPLTANGINGAVIRIDDVTERIHLEESLRQSQKLDAIGQLAGGVAHDFNNMLGGILGGAEILKTKLGKNPETEKYLSLIVDSAKRAADLTGNLLVFSRKGEVGMSRVNVHDAVEGAVNLLESTLDKRISIKKELNAESAIVKGDLSQLQNVFLNLGINAGQSMSSTGQIIYSSRIRVLNSQFCGMSAFDISPGTYLEIEIQDNGTGIPVEIIDRIFEPFFTTKDQGVGTGLGLAAVYGIIKQHKGAVSVQSEMGEGSVFSIQLPLVSGPRTTAESLEGSVRGEGCILVVDDEKIIRTTLQSMLENLGYSVLTAENGQEGLDLYTEKQNSIDLVIMDMIMPEMNGTDCFTAMKKEDPSVKAILISGFSNHSENEDLLELGFISTLRKPVDMHTLSTAVSDALLKR